MIGLSASVLDDQPTIEEGIAAASPGDTVLMASNTYQEHGLSISKQITLAGHYAGSLTVTIDGQNAGRVLNVQGADGVVLSDINFTKGVADYGGAGGFDNCTFESNAAGLPAASGAYCIRARALAVARDRVLLSVRRPI